MRNLILLSAAAATLAACSSNPPAVRPAPVFTVNYRCDSGGPVTVRYFEQQGIAVLERAGQRTEMDRTSTAPITYQGGTTTLVTNNQRMAITLTIAMMAPMSCHGMSSSGRPPAPLPPTPPAPPAPPSPPAGPSEIRTNFACDNGERVSLRSFPQQGIAVLERGGQSTELQQQRVGSGFHYSNGQTSVRGKDGEMTMTVGMMAATQCRAV